MQKLVQRTLVKNEDKEERSEFWTAKQRQMNPIHYTVSYRGSFKPELPQFFIDYYLEKQSGHNNNLMDQKDCIVFDPFVGVGGTLLGCSLSNRKGI